jgi:hypothetical protein
VHAKAFAHDRRRGEAILTTFSENRLQRTSARTDSGFPFKVRTAMSANHCILLPVNAFTPLLSRVPELTSGTARGIVSATPPELTGRVPLPEPWFTCQ